ncbi:MAG TPA: RagB/SusD family nutrient uptake outer membrane protein [Bacteroidales bacterium]|nr:RagB/SusD family nutrient uptake outer membrane protein [Bacteroidales bacterium]HPJ58534.1 RagB/SusD family nutrient uptake outer membrane protein [Bacteroidales bacterium]HPR11709.1 RagB/SusD family nutrient uptake outer membrane protein [Bacteroidales bacterium]HRW86459.1 RagB/SusD family nutrient uptake outer membrane protein [Bacteroidales bacterium]
MKKLLFIILVAGVLFNTSCNKDYLNVSSPSAVDQDFVFSAPEEAWKVMVGCYDIWRGGNNGLFYDIDIVGSDAECHPETYDAQQRHIPEGLYASEIPINYSNSVGIWASLYSVANRSNMIMEAIREKPEYQSGVTTNTANVWTQLYGEAAVFRAYAYFNLIRYFGDVPYFQESIYSTAQTDSSTLISRDIIYDGELENLIAVEPLMYRLGEGGINAERFSRTFAQALIGKMALFAGGYGLRRTDFDYGNVTFIQKGTEQWNAKYVRLTNYKDYYEIARTYLAACVQNPGSAYLITTDPRGAGFNNPFQYNFQRNMDLVVSPESIYEVGITRAQSNSERPYAFGRPSGGGGSNAYPCKSYGQSRLYASFYYGDFDPKDLRRDVTATVTANSGACSEVIVDFTPGSRNKGGLPNNKWDESRMADPWTTRQRQSGVNWVQMRMADVILMLAEVYAELDQEPQAKAELTKVRSRAFSADDQTAMVTDYIAGLSGEALKEAIQQERKLELAGEGYRRFDLIRTGKLPEKIVELRDLQTEMVDGLSTDGYYTFANGNTISNYIWVKKVNVSDLGMSKMLTAACTVDETDPTWPVRFPGWRGNCDLWGDLGFTGETGTRNLAIQGLFRYIDPTGLEATSLEADGYVKTAWGANIIANADQYTTNIFKGYPDSYYSTGIPPRYLFPLSSETISKSNGLITNGYGFPQE